MKENLQLSSLWDLEEEKRETYNCSDAEEPVTKRAPSTSPQNKALRVLLEVNQSFTVVRGLFSHTASLLNSVGGKKKFFF